MQATINENSRLYDIVSQLNLMATESTAIDRMRQMYKPFVTLPLVNWDIERIGYRYKHFDLPSYMVKNKDSIEVWVKDRYAHEITFIEDTIYPDLTHCILPFDTDETECNVRYNEEILFFYHDCNTDYESNEIHEYILELELTDPRITNLRDIENSPYAITDGEYVKPEVTITDTVVRYTTYYRNSISFYLERDIVYCGHVTEGECVYIDDPMSQYTYGSFMIDSDSNAEIDTRFYPCVLPKVSGFLRLYSDNYLERPYPEFTRVINYMENIPYFNDPYNSPLFDRLGKPTNAVIDSDMSDNEILEAFAAISTFCYRWNEAPIFQDIAPVYTVLNNVNKFDDPVFNKMIYHPTTDTSIEAYVSTFPYDEYADVILYKGKVIYDYFTEDISFRNNEAWVDHLYGKRRYVITGDYDPDELTVLKFHSHENTSVSNIEPWLDKDNLLMLHRKVNRFWHNMIALTAKSAEIFAPDEQVWVGVEEPDELDDHLWFELMTYLNDITVENDEKNLFPLFIAGTQPDVEGGQYPSTWKNKTLSWIGEGSGISTEEVFNRILYTENELLDKHAAEELVLVSVDEEEPLFPELRLPTELHTLYWDKPELEDVLHSDIWMQWYANVKDHISYSSENTLLMHINENVYTIEFDPELDDLRIIAFDDIVLNFRNWDRGVRYLSILADLQQSGIVKPEDMMIFYNRLITSKDHFDPGLHRVKTHISNVVSHAKTDIENFTVIYGTNIMRQHWDRDSGSTPIPDPTFPMTGSIMSEDMPGVSNDYTFNYFTYPNPKKTEVKRGNLLINYGNMELAGDMQIYNRYLLVTEDPSDIYLNELVLQELNEDEFKRNEYSHLYDHNPLWNEDQPYTFTRYLQLASREISKLKDSPRYILQHMAALAQEEFYKARRREEGLQLASGYIQYYTRDDFSYIPNKCLVFVNGKYVPESKLEQCNNYRIAIMDFDELIETVDIFYCRSDIPQMRLQHSSEQHIPTHAHARRNLGRNSMEYININRENYQGYYDILRKDYLDNNKLIGLIQAYIDDQDMYDIIMKDFFQQFSQITTAGLFGSNVKRNRIIVSGGGKSHRYRIFKDGE